MTDYRESVKAAGEATEKEALEVSRKTNLTAANEVSKKNVDSSRPMRPSKPSSITKTSNTAKVSTPGSSRNRPPMANSQNISPSPRGGL